MQENIPKQSREQYLLSLSQKLVGGEELSEDELASLTDQEVHEVHAEARAIWLTNLGEQIGAGKIGFKDITDPLTKDETFYVRNLAIGCGLRGETLAQTTYRIDMGKPDPAFRGEQLVERAKRRRKSDPIEIRKEVIATLREEYPELLEGPCKIKENKATEWMKISRAVDKRLERVFKLKQ